MKKFVAILLTAVMLLGMVYVPAFAADATSVKRLTADFQTGTLNPEGVNNWRTSSQTPSVAKKATVTNPDNYAVLISGSDGKTALQNYVGDNCTQLDVTDRGVYEFDLFIENAGHAQVLPIFQPNAVKTADGKAANFYALLNYNETDSTLGIRTGTYTTAATLPLSKEAWADVRVDINFAQATYRVYLNDILMTATDGTCDFGLRWGAEVLVDAGEVTGGTEVIIASYANYSSYTSENADRFWVDNVDFRAATYADADGQYVGVVSSSVADGETEVDLKPQLSYTFSHELNPATLKNISLNNDSSYVKSATLSADKKTVNIELDRNLAYNTTYTLDFGFTEAAYGCLVTDTITFSTLSAENLFFDDFEADTINTSEWTVYDDETRTPAVLTVDPKDSENNVVLMESTEALQCRFDNYKNNDEQSSQQSDYIPGDVLIEFDMMIDSASTSDDFNFINAICSNSNNLVKFYKTNQGDPYTLKFMNESSYVTTSCVEGDVTVNVNEWYNYKALIRPCDGTYDLYLDSELVVDGNSLLNYDKDMDYVKWLRFVLFANNHAKIYLDNLKIARNMWMTDGGFYNADGAEIDVLDPECTTYKASIINRAPVAENMKLYLATYSADGKELKDIIIKDVTVPAGKTATVEHSFKDLGVEAYDSMIKAIFVKNQNTLEPYRAALGLSVSEILAGTVPEVVTATLSLGESVASVFPGGHYKAVTMRFDDGKVWDKEVLKIMNANGLKGTFYLISDNVKSGNAATWITASDIKTVYAGHEVGNHSKDHKADNVSVATLTEAREYLEAVWGDDVIGFAYPDSTYGTHGQAAYWSYLEQSGHEYANMASVWDRNITVTTLPDITKPFGTESSCRMKYTDFEEATKAYAANTDKTQSLLFTMQHASDFLVTNDDGTKSFDPTIMNTFAENIANKPDIWYCTNGEAITYLMAQAEMNVPATGSSATLNKTEKTLYYIVGDELVEVTPGSKLMITVE